MTTIIKQNDCGYDIVQHTFKSRRPLYLEGASVRFVMGSQDYKKLLINADAYILSSSETEATLEYKFTQQDTLYPGRFIGMFIVTWEGGNQKTFPSGSSIPVEIQRTLDLGVPTQFEDRQALKVSLIDERFEEMKVDVEAFKKSIEALGQNISSLNEQQRAELDQRMGTAEEKVAAVEEEQAFQEKRIDNIMKESGNDSASAAEIRDAHLGADGVARPNLGSMMREMHKQQIDGNAQTSQLKRGLNLVQSDQSSPVDFELQGQTRVNLYRYRTMSYNVYSQDGTIYREQGLFGQAWGAKRLDNPSGHLQLRPFGVQEIAVQFKAGKKYLFGAYILAKELSSNVDNPSTTTGKIMASLRSGSNIDTTLQSGKAVSVLNKWILSYGLYNPTQDSTGIVQGQILQAGNKGEFLFDGAFVYELTDAEYTEALTLTDAQLAEKYPYIDGVQHVRNPVVTKKGKNLIPPFYEWTVVASSAVNIEYVNPYKVIVDARNNPSASLQLRLPVNVPKNTNMTISIPQRLINPESRIYVGVTPDGFGNNIQTLSSQSQVTFYTGNNELIYIVAHLRDRTVHEFENIQLELGTIATPFQPQNNDHLYFPDTLLGSSLDGTVRDSIYKKDGKYFVREFWNKEYVFNGSLPMYVQDSGTGFKRIKSTSYILPNVSTRADRKAYGQVKGVLLPFSSGQTTPDTVTIHNDGSPSIILSNGVTGFTDGVTPTATELKDFFTNNPVKFIYELASPVERELTVEGEIGFHSGVNLVELDEGLIVREKVTLRVASTGIPYINWHTSPDSHTKNKVQRFVEIYKNGEKDKGWTYSTNFWAVNNVGAYNETGSFDPKATYTVTYVPMDKHTLTAAVTKATATYNTNHKTVQDALVQGQTDMKAQVNVQALQLLEVFARLRAGGI